MRLYTQTRPNRARSQVHQKWTPEQRAAVHSMILDEIAKWGTVSIGWLITHVQISRPTANDLIADLIVAGLVEWGPKNGRHGARVIRRAGQARPEAR